MQMPTGSEQAAARPIEPRVYTGWDEGTHGKYFAESVARLERAQTYRDLSTVILFPSRGMTPARVWQAFAALIRPMNQRVTQIVTERLEVGAAYEHMVGMVIADPQWRYVLTCEEDNLPPPDGLLRLFEALETPGVAGLCGPGYDAVGGLYWTKGEEGQPMIYGDPAQPINFIPQVPQLDTVQECHGLGMGFTLFKADLFRKVEPPWFVTLQAWDPAVGVKSYTQDLYFFEKARRAGARVACDTRVRVGHMDSDGVVW